MGLIPTRQEVDALIASKPGYPPMGTDADAQWMDEAAALLIRYRDAPRAEAHRPMDPEWSSKLDNAARAADVMSVRALVDQRIEDLFERIDSLVLTLSLFPRAAPAAPAVPLDETVRNFIAKQKPLPPEFGAAVQACLHDDSDLAAPAVPAAIGLPADAPPAAPAQDIARAKITKLVAEHDRLTAEMAATIDRIPRLLAAKTAVGPEDARLCARLRQIALSDQPGDDDIDRDTLLAAARIEALAGENAELRRDQWESDRSWQSATEQAARDNAELTARLSAAEADAARLDWLDDPANSIVDVSRQIREARGGIATYRAAIDAVMAESLSRQPGGAG